MEFNTRKTAMILAAGLGTRLRPYTRHTPKALFTINQQPVLAVVIDKLIKAGFQKILINTHHHHEQIEAFVNATALPIPVILSHEPEILGTGGGIRNTADKWQPGPLLVINADIVSSIDLEEVYRFHDNHRHAVTMVMHDRREFNSVTVENDFITGFKAAKASPGAHQTLAFTGIHVLDKRILDFLPSTGPAHIIDAYTDMLAAGEKIRVYQSRGHYWQDIGTPPRYRDAVYSIMTPLAFEKAFGRRPTGRIQRHRLHGDGSDRQWYRLSADNKTLIMADHHIRQGFDRQEVDAYVDIGKHLHAAGLAVPQIILHDNCAGLVFLEDLGDRHLQHRIAHLHVDQTRTLYKQVIDLWLDMALGGAQAFDPNWTYQTQHYDRHVVLQNECRYFIEAFVRGYLQWDIRFGEFTDEFDWLADNIVRITTTGFMHRDLQSRNIMVSGDKIYFIDFQGGRLGPLQYDLASLLIDPYVALPMDLQQDLLDYCAVVLQQRYNIAATRFTEGYACCALSRNLQILGAFAYLGSTKGKRRFFNYIPGAAESLRRTLAEFSQGDLPRLKKLGRAIVAFIDKKNGGSLA